MKCPSEGFYAGVTERHISPFSAFSDNRYAAGEFCDFLSGLEPVMAVFAVWSKGCDQFWGKTFSHTRQTLDRVCFGEIIQDSPDFLFIVGDMFFAKVGWRRTPT